MHLRAILNSLVTVQRYNKCALFAEFAEDEDYLDMTEGDLSEANESFKKAMAGKRKASNSLSNKNKVNTKPQYLKSVKC